MTLKNCLSLVLSCALFLATLAGCNRSDSTVLETQNGVPVNSAQAQEAAKAGAARAEQMRQQNANTATAPR